jgi:hypothetical protein
MDKQQATKRRRKNPAYSFFARENGTYVIMENATNSVFNSGFLSKQEDPEKEISRLRTVLEEVIKYGLSFSGHVISPECDCIYCKAHRALVP